MTLALRYPKTVYPRMPKALPKVEQYPLYALYFDGVDDYVDAGVSSLFVFPSDFSVAAWVKHTSTKNQIYVSKWTGLGGGSQWWLGFYGSKAAFGCYYGSVTIVYGTSKVADGNWHFVAGVRIGSVGYIYEDGILISSGGVGAGPAGDNTAPLIIGNYNGRSGTWWFNGNIALVYIYGRALSGAEIRHIMYNPLNPPRDGLVLFLPMVEGAETTANDYSGNNINGTIYGATWKELALHEIPAGAGA